jgi:hypothetical protein
LCGSWKTIHGVSLAVRAGQSFLEHAIVVADDGGELGV